MYDWRLNLLKHVWFSNQIWRRQSIRYPAPRFDYHEKIAQQYFGRSNVEGETLILTTENSGKKEYVISKVIQNFTRNSVSDFLNVNAQIFLSVENTAYFGAFNPESWSGAQMISYVKLKKGALVPDVKSAFKKILKRDASLTFGDKLQIELKPLKSYYLAANNGVVKKQLIALSAITIFILLLAVINFINITIGTATVRVKEIGIRKSIGGVKQEIVFQFLVESLMLIIAAFLFAIIFYELSRSHFGEIAGTMLPSLANIPFGFWKISLLIVFFYRSWCGRLSGFLHVILQNY
jgi:putative ABC transport system permease protein